jgi:hypothetical protein
VKTPLPAFSHRTIYDTLPSSPPVNPAQTQINNTQGKTNSFFNELGKGNAEEEHDSLQKQFSPAQDANYRKNDSAQHKKDADQINLDRETYDLQLMSVSHLSYDKRTYFKAQAVSGNPVYPPTGTENILQRDTATAGTVTTPQTVESKSLGLWELFKKYDLHQDDQSRENTLPKANIMKNEPVFLKKVVSVTGSELIIRNFFDDSSKMIEEIKRQLPEGIDRIWLNGKLVWIRDI